MPDLDLLEERCDAWRRAAAPQPADGRRIARELILNGVSITVAATLLGVSRYMVRRWAGDITLSRDSRRMQLPAHLRGGARARARVARRTAERSLRPLLDDALAVACPHCAAAPGARCRHGNGGIKPKPHGLRYGAAVARVEVRRGEGVGGL